MVLVRVSSPNSGTQVEMFQRGARRDGTLPKRESISNPLNSLRSENSFSSSELPRAAASYAVAHVALGASAVPLPPKIGQGPKIEVRVNRGAIQASSPAVSPPVKASTPLFRPATEKRVSAGLKTSVPSIAPIGKTRDYIVYPLENIRLDARPNSSRSLEAAARPAVTEPSRQNPSPVETAKRRSKSKRPGVHRRRGAITTAVGSAAAILSIFIVSGSPVAWLFGDSSMEVVPAGDAVDVASIADSEFAAVDSSQTPADVEEGENTKSGRLSPLLDAGALFGNAAERLAASDPLPSPPSPAPATIPAEMASIAPPSAETESIGLSQRMSMIKFIAGMIAGHLNGVEDVGPIAKDIVEVSSQKKLDPFFIAAVISVESRFDFEAHSKAGALGLMQLLPETARDVLRSQTGRRGYPVLTHTRTNITLGVEYMKTLIARYRGNRFYALAAYNWGPANVDPVYAHGGGIPRSVSKYARTILERATNWKKHYESAEKSASSLAQGDSAQTPAHG